MCWITQNNFTNGLRCTDTIVIDNSYYELHFLLKKIINHRRWKKTKKTINFRGSRGKPRFEMFLQKEFCLSFILHGFELWIWETNDNQVRNFKNCFFFVSEKDIFMWGLHSKRWTIIIKHKMTHESNETETLQHICNPRPWPRTQGPLHIFYEAHENHLAWNIFQRFRFHLNILFRWVNSFHFGSFLFGFTWTSNVIMQNNTTETQLTRSGVLWYILL